MPCCPAPAALPPHLIGHFIRHALPSLFVLGAFALLTACAERPPFVVLTVDDPTAVGADFATLHVGFSRDALQKTKTSKRTFPLSVTLAAEKTGPKTVWVEVRGSNQSPLARGVTETRFEAKGTPTATVTLGRACEDDDTSVCDDNLFCTGPETCADGVCMAGTAPCASNVTCADTTCFETGGAVQCCGLPRTVRPGELLQSAARLHRGPGLHRRPRLRRRLHLQRRGALYQSGMCARHSAGADRPRHLHPRRL